MVVATGVTALHPQYKKMAPKWQRCRDVCEGQDAVHAAGPRYLPRLTDQTDKGYSAYVLRTPLVNFSWRTVAAMEGLLSRKDAKVVVPAAVEPMLADISQSGVPFNVFTNTVIDEILKVGRVGILVDHPTMVDLKDGAVLTKLQAEALGLRPVMQIYKTESITNWSYKNINNKNVLARVVLKECASETNPEDEFNDIEKQIYRVLDLDPANDFTYRVRLFDPKVSKVVPYKTIVPLMDNKPLNYIPFKFIGVYGETTDIEEPPLVDLVDLNLSHYRTNADYEHACHFTGLPTPWITGYEDTSADGEKPDKIYVGSEAFITLSNKDAKLGYLEFTGEGLTALSDNKSSKETQMAMLGSRLLSSDKSGVEAFQTVAIRNNGETSILAGISLSVSLGIKACLQIMADWAGATGNIEFQINRDFMSVTMDAPTLLALTAMVQAGTLSLESFFDLLQRGDVIDQDLTYEEEQARIASKPPITPTGVNTPLTARKPVQKVDPAEVQ